MMKKNGLLFAFLIITLCGFSQQEINFNEEKVQKFLEKKFKAADISFERKTFSAESILNFGVNGQFFKMKSNTQEIGFVYIGRVNSCRAGGCSLTQRESSSFEFFDYLLAFNNEFKVQAIKVINYQATHGHEVCAKSWLKQFVGFDGKQQLSVGKDIDAISGATISVHAITEDINFVAKHLQQEKEGL